MGRQAPFWPQHPCCSHLHAYNACSLCSLWLRPFRLAFLFSALSCLLTQWDTILSLESLDLLLLGWTSLSTLMSIWPHFLKYFFHLLHAFFCVPLSLCAHSCFRTQSISVTTKDKIMSYVFCPLPLQSLHAFFPPFPPGLSPLPPRVLWSTCFPFTHHTFALLSVSWLRLISPNSLSCSHCQA